MNVPQSNNLQTLIIPAKMVAFDAIMTNDTDDCENIGLGCALEHFSEADDVMAMIDNLKNIYNTPTLEVEYEKLYSIVKHYFEQPHLLDPHLEKILAKFLGLIKDKESPMELKHAAFSYMYQIIRVRGYKVVVRHLPHEVSDLMTVLTLLEAQDPKDIETWRSRFVLLLWLSIVVIIPFHMSRLDGFAPALPSEGGETAPKVTVMDRIFNICKTYALSTDVCAEANAFLASKFFIRSDVKELYMDAFFEWAIKLHADLQKDIHYGVLAAVAAVLKHGKRDDLLPYAPKLLEWITTQNPSKHEAILVRKYAVKFAQRIGLTFLKPRVAWWRYTRGSRSLAVTLGGAPASADCSGAGCAPALDQDQDIPQQVEEVVELLLCSLRDEDSVVRWSAAKGVGRIGARLPADSAADVCACVLGLFAPSERDTAWHGGCMALAELARRGLLSPQQLGDAVSAVVAALARDEPRTTSGGGGKPTRDSACHASWAFARAYDATALAPYAETLAYALISTTCFDREINCRRAASAAYQENVGRHGLFPNGIDILTIADFQSVGPRNNAYLVIAPKIAHYPSYTQPLIDHLVDLKVEHWDCAVRELAAKSLHKLTDKLPEYVATAVLPKLLTKTESIDLGVRHGAILAIGEAFHALSQAQLADGKTADTLISSDIVSRVGGLVPLLRSRQQLRGLGGELMRQACCQAIAALAQARAPYHGTGIVDEWLSLIEECLSHEVQAIREKAINALPLVFEQYLRDDALVYGEQNAKQKRMQLVKGYCDQVANTGVKGLLLRMGYSRAVGALPKFALAEQLLTVVNALISCMKVTESTLQWAEARRDAVFGLTDVCQCLGVKDGVETFLGEIVDALLNCLSEYTIDMRGDVGAWVREASMTGLLSICRQCASEAPYLNSLDVIGNVMGGIAQQACEKIDRTRAHAGRIFAAFIYNDPPITNIPNLDALKRIFLSDEVELKPQAKEDDENKMTSENANVVLWLFPGHTMPRFVQLLGYPAYRYHVIKGLVISAGEHSESLVKHTTHSLFAYLNSLRGDRATLEAICDTIDKVFADNLYVNRITERIFKFLDRLLSSGSISVIIEDPESKFAANLLKNLKQAVFRGKKDVYKILDAMNVLCQLLQVGGPVCKEALNALVLCLGYKDSYVRRCTATRMYEAFTLYGDVCTVPQDNIDQVQTILAETNWEQDRSELKSVRDELCDLMGAGKPVAKKKT